MPPPTNADRAQRMHASPAWSGETFTNRLPSPMMNGSSFRTMTRFMFERAEREPPCGLPSVPVAREVLAGPGFEGLRATWLGHSTTLLELAGRRVLTDPVWSDRISPVSFTGPKRFQPVPANLADLAIPDVVIVSHDHYDHLDRPTVVALAKRGARFVMPLGVGAHLESWGIASAQITELDWWEAFEPVPGLRVQALPARHFSGRSVFDRNATLWASWSIAVDSHRVYFGGDGGFDEGAFREIGTRCGPFDLTMLEIGAFDPAWGTIHLGPENAVRAQPLLRGQRLLPIHWGTFNLGLHAWDAPAEELLVAAQGMAVELAMPQLGESVIIGERQANRPWWRAVRDRALPVVAPVADLATRAGR